MPGLQPPQRTNEPAMAPGGTGSQRGDVRAGDLVAVRHEHAQYRYPYFLAVLRESPVDSALDGPVRLTWAEQPQETKSAVRYTLGDWVDQYVQCCQRTSLLVNQQASGDVPSV